jgi:hypothetical protein
MYTTIGYLYNQIHTVTVGTGPSDRWNLMYYAKNVKLHKGVDNPVKFRIKNQNQKNVDVSNSEFYLYITDAATNAEILNKTLILESATTGLVSTVITEEDLLDFDLVRYHYGIKMVDSTGNEYPIYVDDNYSATGVIEVSNTAYPNHENSTELTVTGYDTDDIAYTSTIPVTATNNGIHTVAYYLTGFSGTIVVQGHLEDSNTVFETDYISITENTYANQTGVVSLNFTGLFKGIRFKITKTAGSVDRILHKN